MRRSGGQCGDMEVKSCGCWVLNRDVAEVGCAIESARSGGCMVRNLEQVGRAERKCGSWET